MNLVNKIKNFVEEECKKSSSKYGYEPFIFHFIPVVRYAEELVNNMGGDKEVILIAAWLHDIGSIISGRDNHHITGAKIAEEKLKEFGYPIEKIELIKKCILNHRGSVGNARLSTEEQIIADADAMSNFDNVAGIFKAAFIYENLDQGKAKEALLIKLENKWRQLHFKDSKKIIKPKYEALKILFK